MSRERTATRYHYYYINNVIAHFFKDTLSYFRDYLYPRFKVWSVISTYDKAVELLSKKDQVQG